jgi:hypothetical protein
MAWRPPYHPQFPQTTWGSLVAPQRGHTLRAGVSSCQALARRLRLFALEVFFLGTAIGDPHLENGSCRGKGIGTLPCSTAGKH